MCAGVRKALTTSAWLMSKFLLIFSLIRYSKFFSANFQEILSLTPFFISTLSFQYGTIISISKIPKLNIWTKSDESKNYKSLKFQVNFHFTTRRMTKMIECMIEIPDLSWKVPDRLILEPQVMKEMIKLITNWNLFERNQRVKFYSHKNLRGQKFTL